MTIAGRNSKLWSDISAIEVLRVTPQRRKNPLTPIELREVARKLPLRHARIAWAMALSGMGPGEFWGSWEIGGNLKVKHIAIHGTKRAGRERKVPLVHHISPPIVQYAAFRRALAEAGAITPYDLRRTYANWLESAGVPRTRRKLYLGHGSGDVTALYEWHEVEYYLDEDAAKLRAYVFGATENTV